MTGPTATNICDRIVAWGSSHPDRVAIEFDGDIWTYGRLASAVDTWAARFAQSGIGRADTVLVFLPQTADAIAVFFGAMRCGGIPSFMPLPSVKQDPAHYWESHRELLRLVKPATVVTQLAQVAPMRAAGFDTVLPRILACDQAWPDLAPWKGPAPGGPDNVALLQHSSGTTALKKGVQLTHRAIDAQIRSYAQALESGADEVVVSWLPMYHDMGLIACTVTPLMLGQKLVLLDPFAWVGDPVSLLRAITRHRGTLTWLPNFAFELLARTARFEPGELDLHCVKAFINCSEPCKPATFDRFLARFAAVGVQAQQLQVCYAMAETVFAVSQTAVRRSVRRIAVDAGALSAQRRVRPPADDQSALVLLSAGRLIEGISAAIVGDDGRALPMGEVGEIELRGEFLFSGYLNRPEVTAERLHDGAYRTRDLGFVDDGELFVLGRIDDLIIVHGRNYFAHEVEALVNEFSEFKPGRNVAVDVFNEMLGSQEVVVIAELAGPELPDAAHATALRRRVKHAVTEQMGLELRDVRMVAPGWLAKTTSGKISRALNRTKYLEELERGRKR